MRQALLLLLSLLLVSPTFAKESTDKPYAGSTQPPLSPAEAHTLADAALSLRSASQADTVTTLSIASGLRR